VDASRCFTLYIEIAKNASAGTCTWRSIREYSRFRTLFRIRNKETVFRPKFDRWAKMFGACAGFA
jgi:hypothetical protein